jgi:hypothetical protein
MAAPVNEQPHVKLREYVLRSGFGILNDAAQCEAWLNNACPQSQWEISIMMSAMRQGVPAAIGGRNPAVAGQAFRPELVQRLQSSSGLAPDAAQWGVDAWAYILGVDLNAAPVQAQMPVAVIPTPQYQAQPQVQQHAHPHVQFHVQVQAPGQPAVAAAPYVRPRLQMPDVPGRMCTYCGAPAPGQNCPTCNRDTTAPRRVCRQCGRITPVTEPKCLACGKVPLNELAWKIPILIGIYIVAIVIIVILNS